MDIKKLNEELAKFVEDWPDNKEFNALFDQHVPAQGHANTLGGELIRAVNKIVYRYYNDGDRVGVGYGNETCNPAARFIEENTKLEPLAKELWNLCSDKEYEELLADLMQAAIEICKKDNLFEQPILPAENIPAISLYLGENIDLPKPVVGETHLLNTLDIADASSFNPLISCSKYVNEELSFCCTFFITILS